MITYSTEAILGKGKIQICLETNEMKTLRSLL